MGRRRNFQKQADPFSVAQSDGGGKVIIVELDAIFLEDDAVNESLLRTLARHQKVEGDHIIIALTDGSFDKASIEEALALFYAMDPENNPNPNDVSILPESRLAKTKAYAFTVFATKPVAYVSYNLLGLVNPSTGGILALLSSQETRLSYALV